MTLRRRILFYYAATLSVSLVIVAFWSWFEFNEQRDAALRGGAEAALKHNPLVETVEIILLGGLPALLLGIIGGSLLMRRALRPIEELTEALEKTTASNLAEPVARSGNGDELDRMSAVFNGMKERLGTSFTQAREFTLHASHELKTPLTILHGTLEQMMGDTTTPTAHRERITSMLEEVQRLSSIVGQLAFLAKADAGLLETPHGTVALHDLVRDLVEDLTLLSAAQNISITLDACQSTHVNGDRMRLRQLLLILGDNAVKHNHKYGSITLALHQDEAHVTFRITNTGPALPPDLRSRVFERFLRGDASHSSTVEGSGLGLSIAESIAKSHRGTLVFEVIEGDRTQLTLSLPSGH
ncbi:HAMP domain-containing sensor histidine kinase [Prosthecobacter sp.]|uniref:sensor histidine kinase n=1 Tax=Prosthecobacter sp. TaxID=1965333 RepID=UPI0024875194|nr:HAMP domain-containing sensor histidine kinase [Prosthecobacter sp.]MDI1311266.1 HAMP domain-containing sensor histidine kinase [Prosthecobacter sp.]